MANEKAKDGTILSDRDSDDMMSIQKALDGELTLEVLWSAFNHMSQNPKATIYECIRAGRLEWDVAD